MTTQHRFPLSTDRLLEIARLLSEAEPDDAIADACRDLLDGLVYLKSESDSLYKIAALSSSALKTLVEGARGNTELEAFFNDTLHTSELLPSDEDFFEVITDADV